MALNKRTYTDGITVITAGNLNDIQDAIIALEGQDIPDPYNSNPEAPGEASPGTSDEFARGDHVHPLPPVDSALSDSSENPVQNKVIKAALDDKADIIVSSASGPIASFADGSTLPVKDLTVAIEPVQDLHGYANPWPGGGGKNLLQTTASTDTISGVTFTVQSDGTVKLSGTASANYQFVVGSVALDAGTYILSGVTGGTAQTVYVQITNEAMTSQLAYSTDGDKTFTLESSQTVVYRITLVNGANTGSFTIKPMIRLSTVSDATFAPYSNICPISGWTGANVTRTGKNLFRLGLVPSAFSGLTVANIPDGYRLTATSANTYLWARFTLLDAGRFAGKTLTVKGKANASNSQPTQLALYYRDASDVPVQNVIGAVTNGYAEATLTLPSDAAGSVAVVLYCATTQVPSIGDTVEWTELQLEIGSSATAYEPYQGDTYSIAFPSEAGTVYGGTLDVTTGKLTVDRAGVDMGTLAWENRHSTAQGLFTCSIADRLYSSSLRVECSKYPYKGTVTATNSAASKGDKALTFYYLNSQTYKNIYIYDTDYSSATDAQFATSLSGQTLVYELATPVEYTLTPTEVTTLLGTNNIWADTGDSTVQYRADTKLYIDQKITAAIAAALNS